MFTCLICNMESRYGFLLESPSSGELLVEQMSMPKKNWGGVFLFEWSVESGEERFVR